MIITNQYGTLTVSYITPRICKMQRNNRTHLLKCVKTNPNQESIVAMIRCVQTCTNAMNGVSKDVEACMELCVRSLSMRRSFKQSLFQSEFDDLRYAQRNDLICLFIFSSFIFMFIRSFGFAFFCFVLLVFSALVPIVPKPEHSVYRLNMVDRCECAHVWMYVYICTSYFVHSVSFVHTFIRFRFILFLFHTHSELVHFIVRIIR